MRALRLFLFASLVISVASCSGGSGSPPPPGDPAIAFASRRALDGSDAANGAFNIWIMSADGSGAVPLTRLTAGTSAGEPAWSPDKSKIAFSSNRAEDGSDALNSASFSWIWVVNVDGSHQLPLTSVSDGSGYWFVTEPAWSPDGLKLSAVNFCCTDKQHLHSDVAVLNADGTNYTVLTSFDDSVPESGASSGRWSPDGSKLLFDAPGNAAPGTAVPVNIWVMNADGSDQRALTHLTISEAADPQWSPDGSQIAFWSLRALDGSDASNTTSNIWVMKADGSNVRPVTKLTANGADCYHPSWSPDGTKLSFESERTVDGNDKSGNVTNLWVINADGTGTIPLTTHTATTLQSQNAVWSPDGLKLAFESTGALDGSDSAGQASNIWIVNADGSDARPLTKNTAVGSDSFQPKWRP
jgi:TolB protein